MNNLVTIINNQPKTTSLIIAETFGKQHHNVLKAIERLEMPDNFEKVNFNAAEYESKNNLGFVVKNKMYEITRDGFTLLAMGFTGKKAMQFKIAYIEAFNKMEEELLKRNGQSSLIEVSPYTRRLPSGKKEIVLSEKARSEIGGIVKACCGVAIREALSGLIKAYENETPVKTEWPAEADQSLKGVAEAIVDYGRSEYTRGKIEGILKATFDENYQQMGKGMSIRAG